MARSDITIEQAMTVADRVAQELGLLRKDTSGFYMWAGPTNKHRLYVQKSRHLGRIDFTIDLPTDDPAYRQLSTPNGSIKCHVAPDLVQFERCLRMLGDGTLTTQVPNKPRPFAATKQPARKAKALAPPVPEEDLKPIEVDGELKDRVAEIRARAREARINMILENPEKYGEMARAEAEAVVDDKVDLSELAEAHRNRGATELAETIAETGIEVMQ